MNLFHIAGAFHYSITAGVSQVYLSNSSFSDAISSELLKPFVAISVPECIMENNKKKLNQRQRALLIQNKYR